MGTGRLPMRPVVWVGRSLWTFDHLAACAPEMLEGSVEGEQWVDRFGLPAPRTMEHIGSLPCDTRCLAMNTTDIQ